MDNDNCTAHIKRIGCPNCDKITREVQKVDVEAEPLFEIYG